jgi:hypothetical protein
MMRKSVLATSIVASAALLVLAAAPAFADTPTTFALVGGTLAISAPTASVSLGTSAPMVTAQVISGALGAVTVTDNRGGILGWVASVGSTAFTGPATVVPATALTYIPSLATTTGVALVAATTAIDLTAPKTVQTATTVVGANTAVWNPTLTVAVPAGAQAGLYAATVTHSIL